MKLAIVGSGIAGLAVAHTLRGRADITLFEAGDYFGGHTHTVDVTLPTAHGPVTHGIDTGFLVFNERTYPNLINLLAELGVPTARSDMSFSVQVPNARRGQPLEWSGSSLNTVFAQRGNLLDRRFLTMLRDLLRFNRLATRLATRGQDAELLQPLAAFLREHRFSAEFCDWYFLPMIGCIWSCPPDQMLQFPVATMVRRSLTALAMLNVVGPGSRFSSMATIIGARIFSALLAPLLSTNRSSSFFGSQPTLRAMAKASP